MRMPLINLLIFSVGVGDSSMENILVSACLLGMPCRYDGKSVRNVNVIKLSSKYNLIPFCSEIYGGLSTPRQPAEIIGDRVITKDGKDVMESYKKGAWQALEICNLLNCKKAILKEKSPSCGYGFIHNGKFDNGLIKGNGITAQLLSDNNIKVFGDTQINEL